MILAPNPVLNDEEQELLNSAPEECFRHAITTAASRAASRCLAPSWRATCGNAG